LEKKQATNGNLKRILRFRGPRKRKAQPGGEAASSAACAIAFYVSLDEQTKAF
jgi:hypothetical protein